MRQKSVPTKEPADQVIKDIRRATRRHFSAEDKIRIVLEGLRGEASIAELCRREGIVQNLYYRWSKEFLEAGKKRLAGDTARAATTDEVKECIAHREMHRPRACVVLAGTRGDSGAWLSDRVLVSDRVRQRSSSPWSSALHPRRSASEFFRSTSVLGEAATHYIR